MLLLLPSHFRARAEFHHRLGQFVGAGLSVVEALETLRASPPSPVFRARCDALLADLTTGRSVGDAFRRQEAEFSPLDVSLIEAGERSGRLGACFHLLAAYYRERASLAADFASQLAYPAFVLFLGLIVFGLLLPWAASQGQASLSALALRLLSRLLLVGSLLGILVFVLQGQRGRSWRGLIETALAPVPWLGAGRRALALSRLAFALEALVSAGVGFPEAWPLAARASHSPKLEAAGQRGASRFEAGESPAQWLRSEPLFAGYFAQLYASGETTGTLQDSLRRIAVHYQEEGVRKLRSFTAWLPRLLYLGLAVYLGYRILDFYRGYFRTIDSFFHP
ncbi:MAG: type II secretion system F family protein [Verrucomicrobia bacterium]|nr:type II secretion system F family protein [Verrucomicrobiota bacterium]